MIDWKICSHCQDKFIFNHDYYRPKVKYTEEGILVYCSDYCLMGLDLKVLAPCDCHGDMRKMMLTEGRRGDRWLCFEDSTIFDMPVEAKPIEKSNFLDTMMKEEG